MPTEEKSLTNRTARAAQWRFASSAVAAVAQFGIGVVLSRLLPPSDFGLMALAFVVIGFARPFGDLGVGAALVQRSSITDRHIRAGFTFTLLFGAATTILLAMAAPLGAIALNDPRVTSVLQVAGLGFAMQGAGVVANALLRRRLDFRRLFMIETTSYILGYGGVALTGALLGYGVWSLVFGGLAQTALMAGGQILSVRHSVRPLITKQELRQLLHFGVGASTSGCINYVALNADNFVVGRFMGEASLGLYNRAYQLMCMPYTYAASVMSGVLFPAFSEVQSEIAKLRRAFLTITQFTGMIAAPSMGLMAIAAPYLIRALYGPRWDGTVLPLQILCAAGYLRALYHLCGVVSQSVGRVYGEMFRQVGYAALVIIGAVVGTHFGLAGVAVGVDIAILYMFIAMEHLALKSTGTTWGQYFRVQIGPLVTAAATCGVALIARVWMLHMNAPTGACAAVILVAGGIPWLLGISWNLGQKEFEAVRGSLPAWSAPVVTRLCSMGHQIERLNTRRSSRTMPFDSNEPVNGRAVAAVVGQLSTDSGKPLSD